MENFFLRHFQNTNEAAFDVTYVKVIFFREWYSYHFPELIKIVNDNYMYAKVAQYIKSRKNFTEDMLEDLEEIVMDEGKAQAIYHASKASMGKG